MTVAVCRDLLLHMEWADSRLWAAALDAPGAARDARIREFLHHYHATPLAYLQALRGRPLEIPELRDLPDLTAVARWAREVHRELAAFRDGLDEAHLDRLAELPWAGRVAARLGSAGPATVAECLLQLALHSAHHRGQVAAGLREAGGEPPLTDFIAWVWMRRPAPTWD